MPGFGPETRIKTTLGDVPAALLRRGDEVITPSGVSCTIEWLDRVGLDHEFLHAHPMARPRIVQPGDLGGGLPHRPLVLSGSQEIVPGHGVHPVPAATLLQEAPYSAAGFLYTVFHCGRPVRVLAEGVWCPVDELSSTRGRRIA